MKTCVTATELNLKTAKTLGLDIPPTVRFEGKADLEWLPRKPSTIAAVGN
jgi:hypothetical protein